MTRRRSPTAAPARPSRRGGGRGVLWLIAASLAASALLRLGGETGAAIARDTAQAQMEEDGTCARQEDITVVLGLLAEREAHVIAREAALDDRAQALSVAEVQVRRNLDALAEAEARLERTIALSSRAAEEDLAQLTAVYENMKPRQAAPVFAAMDPEFAAGFLSRMRADAAAAIMAGLDPDTAYAISVLLAGRNAAAATE